MNYRFVDQNSNGLSHLLLSVPYAVEYIARVVLSVNYVYIHYTVGLLKRMP